MPGDSAGIPGGLLEKLKKPEGERTAEERQAIDADLRKHFDEKVRNDLVGKVAPVERAATLRRHRDGRYELHGGSPADRADALEWTSLFQHDAVFSHRHDRALSALPAPSSRW